MIFIDFVFWGWYQILDKTIYSLKTTDDGIGPREHSFFINFLLHGINVWTILSVLLIDYPEKMSNFYIGLLCVVIVFAVGYFLYYKKGRADTVISSKMNAFQVVLSLTLTVAYTVVSIYCMLEIGNYVRSLLNPELR